MRAFSILLLMPCFVWAAKPERVVSLHVKYVRDGQTFCEGEREIADGKTKLVCDTKVGAERWMIHATPEVKGIQIQMTLAVYRVDLDRKMTLVSQPMLLALNGEPAQIGQGSDGHYSELNVIAEVPADF